VLNFLSIGRRRAIVVSVSALVIFALFQLWKEVLEDRMIPKRWGVVEEQSIYRSGQLEGPLIRSMLEDNQIDVIVNMNRWRPDKPEHVAEMEVAEALGIDNQRFSMNGDGTGDAENYALALARVHQAVLDGDRVLVHCTAGSQRTGAVISMYRTLFQGVDPEDALVEMEHYDLERVEDEDLLRFIDNNMVYITRRLVQLGALPEAPDPLPKFF